MSTTFHIRIFSQNNKLLQKHAFAHCVGEVGRSVWMPLGRHADEIVRLKLWQGCKQTSPFLAGQVIESTNAVLFLRDDLWAGLLCLLFSGPSNRDIGRGLICFSALHMIFPFPPSGQSCELKKNRVFFSLGPQPSVWQEPGNGKTLPCVLKKMPCKGFKSNQL